MQTHNAILKQQETRHASKLLKKHGIVCKQLPFGSDAPLYLAKHHWTNRFDEDRDTTIGIFGAIWVAPTLLKKNQFAYNIHSKSLQKLAGYQLTPKKFAHDFRTVVKSKVKQWPGIRLDYGPSTLLQGTDKADLGSFSENVEERILGFVDIYQHIVQRSNSNALLSTTQLPQLSTTKRSLNTSSFALFISKSTLGCVKIEVVTQPEPGAVSTTFSLI